jgi:phosphatidylglycerophosphatase A
MPGTWASLAALPCAWAIRDWTGLIGLAVAVIIVFAVGWWSSARVVQESGVADPGYVVIDEIAGQWIALLAAPLDWRFYLAGFLLFRLFDIWKPFPVSWLDRNVQGGIGIMLDDVAAALYVLILMAIAQGMLGIAR